MVAPLQIGGGITIGSGISVLIESSSPTLTGSVLFNGSNYLTTTQSAYVTSGDFTMECWAYVTSVPSYAGFISMRDQNAPNPGADINLLNNGNIEFAIGNSSQYTSTAMPLNQWVHLAMSRTSGTVSCYVNGTRVSQFNNTDATSTLSGALSMGRYYTNQTAYYLNGYLSNVRYVVGYGIYSGTSITVPTTPLTAVTGTQLLTCQSDTTITDASPNAFTITNNGSAVPATSNPFIGGSTKFNGSNQYLSLPSNQTPLTLGTTTFTVESWVYLTAYAGGGRSSVIYSTNSSNGFNYSIDSSGNVVVSASSVAVLLTTSGVTVSLNSWNHIAVVRNGNTFTVYVNGVSYGTATNSINFTSAASPTIGTETDQYVSGYISNFRVVKGTAVYTANFTPPTTPLTSITNTQLLTAQSTTSATIDASPNAFTITSVNGAIAAGVSPFNTLTV